VDLPGAGTELNLGQLTPLPGGSIVSNSMTVNVKTNSIEGYSLSLYTSSTGGKMAHTSGSYFINPTIGTIASPAVLSLNSWGFAIPKTQANSTGLISTGFDSTYSIENNVVSASSTSKWAAVPTSDTTIKKTTVPNNTTGDNTIVFYGVKADYAIAPGTYEATVTYTAVVNDVPPPTITSVSPSSGPTTGGTIINITGTNFINQSSVVKVTVGGVDCLGPIVFPSQISCATPASSVFGPVDVSVTTITGGTVTLTNGFTYIYVPPTPTAQWVKAADNITNAKASVIGASASSYTIDIDNNMIPVVNKDTTSNYPGYWCNYDIQQWCNAVTVKPSTLAANQAKPAGAEISEDDILGYWVYVPRYAYEVQRYHAWNQPVCGNNQVGAAYADAACTSAGYQARFDIRFEKTIDAKKVPDPGNSTCSTPPASSLAVNLYTGGTNYRTGCGVDRTYGAATGTTWATHPAFTFGSTELNGLWIGKFEATGSIAAPTVKPNLKSQINQAIGVQYDISKSIGYPDSGATPGGNSTGTVTSNSHGLTAMKSRMMKNNEWGAASYLATSIYGTNGAMVQINAAYKSNLQDGNGSTGYGITGCGPQASGNTAQYTITDTNTTGAVQCLFGGTSRSYQTAMGLLASTTQNVYGIYDMSGGAYEYVMGYKGSNNNTSYMAVLPPANYMDNFGITGAFRPVWASSASEQYYNFDRCAWDATPSNPTTTTSLIKCGGHANYETTMVQSVSTYTQSWGTDLSYFVNSTYPWFVRGGNSSDGSYAGLFYSYAVNGFASSYCGFRPSLSAF